MTPLVRWVRRAWEKAFGKYYEGLDPPDRLRAMVVMFANVHPHATREDWVAFASEHAAESYRSGYVRGVEYTERDPERWLPDVTPELVADAVDPGWSLGEGVQLERDGRAAVPDAFAEEVVLRDQLLDTLKGVQR